MRSDSNGPVLSHSLKIGTAMPEISVENVNHRFHDAVRNRTVNALSDVSVEVKKGEFLAIIGPSGCGKTTLFNIISGLYKQADGEVKVFGDKPKIGDGRVGYLFARDALLPWRTAFSNVTL